MHGFAAAGVAADAGRAVVDGEAAETADFNPVSVHQGIAHSVQNGFDGLLGIALIELAKPGGKFFDEIGSGHRTARFRRWKQQRAHKAPAVFDA
ncbi:hypothetical protein GCM10010975_34330 [Comamonas phosphati]|nr:hypothetical protein GCM10010975_34330 [Comamonas phosphati]